MKNQSNKLGNIILSRKPQRENHKIKLINKMILTKLFFFYYTKDAPTPCFMLAPTDKDELTPCIFLHAPIDRDATKPLYSN